MAIGTDSNVVIDDAAESVVTRHLTNSKQAEDSSPPIQTPPPLPPFSNLPLRTKRRAADPHLEPLNTDLRSSSTPQGLSSAPTTADSATQTTTFIPTTPYSASSEKTPTPTTPQLHEMLETYPELPPEEVERLLSMFERVTEHRVEVAKEQERASLRSLQTPLKPVARQESYIPRSGISNAAAAPFTRSALSANPASAAILRQGGMVTPIATPGEEGETRPALSAAQDQLRLKAVKIRIMQRLLPAKIILGRVNMRDAPPPSVNVRKAAGHAYMAFVQARTLFVDCVGGEGPAIQGWCAYYIGLAEWALLKHAERQAARRSPRTVGFEEEEEAEEGREEGRPSVLEIFSLAVRAKEGGYEEGKLADVWVSYLNATGHEEVERGEETRERVWWWAMNKSNPFRVTSEFRADDEGGDVFDDRKNRGAGESLAMLDDSDFQPSLPSAKRSEGEERHHFIVSPTPPSTSGRWKDGESSPELPRPVTSPKRHYRSKSLSFKLPRPYPPGRSIYRRKGSGDGSAGGISSPSAFLTRVTGREKPRSEDERAEEGEGPMSPREGLKKRRSGQVEPGEEV
jgi:hypothetical protein